MCCRTISFCCTNDMRKGIMIAGIIDVALLLAIIIINIVMQSNYVSLWFVVVIIADILLIIGAMNANTGLLMVWMIIGMINTVFLFIGWLALPIYGVFVIFVTAVCNGNDIQTSLNSLSNLGNGNNANDVDLNVDCQGAEKGIIAWFTVNIIFIIAMPIYYIYLWVVVKSHREDLVQGEMSVQPNNSIQMGKQQGT